MDAPASPDSPPDRHTRLIRSYALREDADRACEVLADSGIGSTVRELRAPAGGGGKTVFRGCNLTVAPEDAPAATRLLLQMPPSEAPSTRRSSSPENNSREIEKSGRSESPSRFRRRAGPSPKQRGSFLIIGFAVLCAAGAILFASLQFMGGKKEKPPGRKSIRIEEDLNGDTLPDVVREFTPDWVPVFHAEDRNFDDEIDIQWFYRQGRPATREMDINYDGTFDEKMYFGTNGQPFYSDFRPAEKGPVLRRMVYRSGLLWKTLEDRDADSKFDHLRELDRYGATARDEALPPDSAENQIPSWPVPQWPDEEDQEPKLYLTPAPGALRETAPASPPHSAPARAAAPTPDAPEVNPP
jgi:hypothetical protein